jgi:hypothetical protein
MPLGRYYTKPSHWPELLRNLPIQEWIEDDLKTRDGVFLPSWFKGPGWYHQVRDVEGPPNSCHWRPNWEGPAPSADDAALAHFEYWAAFVREYRSPPGTQHVDLQDFTADQITEWERAIGRATRSGQSALSVSVLQGDQVYDLKTSVKLPPTYPGVWATQPEGPGGRAGHALGHFDTPLKDGEKYYFDAPLKEDGSLGIGSWKTRTRSLARARVADEMPIGLVVAGILVVCALACVLRAYGCLP